VEIRDRPYSRQSGLCRMHQAIKWRWGIVNRRQLSLWRIAGVIPSCKLGRAVRFRASEVAAALERNRAG